MALINIVTGATQGIGLAIAESLARNHPEHTLFLIGRSKDRGNEAVRSIQSAHPKASSVFFEACDLSDYNQVLELKGRIAKQVDEDFRVNCLVNCAAECPKRQEFVERRKTDGSVEQLDKQFASNVLGYHFMIRTFQHHFQDSHIVNVASNWAGDLDLNDLNFSRRAYDNDTAYRQSKQCDRMLTKVWADKLPGVAKVNSCHPGDPRTKLSTDLGYNMWASAPTCNMIETQTPIPFLCGYRGNLQTTGRWFDGRGETPSICRFMRMTKESQKLFDICEQYCTT